MTRTIHNGARSRGETLRHRRAVLIFGATGRGDVLKIHNTRPTGRQAFFKAARQGGCPGCRPPGCLLSGHCVVPLTAAVGAPTLLPSFVRVVHAHTMLSAGRTAARGVEATEVIPFLIAGTESKRLVALHAKQNSVVHRFSLVEMGSISSNTADLHRSIGGGLLTPAWSKQ